jgi:hypothetical protein
MSDALSVTATVEAVRVESAAGRAARCDRRFFTGMAVAAVLTVFAGFAPTYFLKALFKTPALTPLFHLHGLLFTSWMVLFLAQTTLVSLKRTDLHRRLGAAGGLLAASIVIIGFIGAVSAARRGTLAAATPGLPPPLVFLAVPIGDLVVFSVLVATGLYYKRRSDVHKRLMLLATIGILTPAIARLPYISGAGPLAFFGVTELFIAACFLYDRALRGGVHPASLWGGLFIVASQPLRMVIGGTHAWIAFAGWLTR